MPAIKAIRRTLYEPELQLLLSKVCELSDKPVGVEDGDITYLITKIVVRFISCRGKSYKSLKDADGILDTAREELYRQITAPYEDKKFKDNDPDDSIYGDVR